MRNHPGPDANVNTTRVVYRQDVTEKVSFHLCNVLLLQGIHGTHVSHEVSSKGRVV
jgi:hypothetical protein